MKFEAVEINPGARFDLSAACLSQNCGGEAGYTFGEAKDGAAATTDNTERA